MLRHVSLSGVLHRTTTVLAPSCSSLLLRHASSAALKKSKPPPKSTSHIEALKNLQRARPQIPSDSLPDADARVPVSVLKLPSFPGARVDLSSSFTRLQAAQQIALALLHRKAASDAAAQNQKQNTDDADLELTLPGLSTQEIWKLSETEFPERPYPVAPEPGPRFTKRGRLKGEPPAQPRPGHAIHSMKFLKNEVLPLLASRHLIRKSHHQRPPLSDLEQSRLFLRAKKLAKRAKTEAKVAAKAQARGEVGREEGEKVLREGVGEEALREAQAMVGKTSLVDVWRWELVPEEERVEHEQRAEKIALAIKEREGRLREDGRPAEAPYGAGRLDHLNRRRRATRMAEERVQRVADMRALGFKGAAAFWAPGVGGTRVMPLGKPSAGVLSGRGVPETLRGKDLGKLVQKSVGASKGTEFEMREKQKGRVGEEDQWRGLAPGRKQMREERRRKKRVRKIEKNRMYEVQEREQRRM